jgi:hypothetical protein
MWGGVEWDIPCLLQAKKKKSTKNRIFKPADSASQKTQDIHYKIHVVDVSRNNHCCL